MPAKKNSYILWFDEVDKDNLPQVGGKGANLGEMTQAGISVPPGFIVTTKAYRRFIKENNLADKIKEALKITHPKKPETYQTASKQIKRLFNQSEMPRDIAIHIMKAYSRLGGPLKNALVAIRSSATAEDLPSASFAGQQVTYLNIKGEANVVKKVIDCWASLFEARGIFYREEHGFEHDKVFIAVPIQKMVQSTTSGVIFTADPTGQQKNIIIIEAVWGLGEYIVQGKVIPDQYIVNFKTNQILRRKINQQKVQFIKKGGKNVRALVPSSHIKKRKLNDATIKKLAKIAKKIHQHYFFPQDIEWAKEKNKIYIVQTRPITTIPKKETAKTKAKKALKKKSKIKPLLVGIAASPGQATGRVVKIKSIKEFNRIKSGDILVTEMTSPDFVPIMKLVEAIVTNQGGQTSHAAIVSRELGVPCVVGTEKATKILKEGQIITVDGTTGQIFDGQNKTKVKKEKKRKLKYQNVKTATKIYLNLGEPSLAKEMAKKNVDGVGLLRAEFMMAQIGIHPRALIEQGKENEFVDQLTKNLKTFCRAFHPRPVVYRTSDFKTNEYRHLKGGDKYEQKEENPLLGFRGAARYIVDDDVLNLELRAIKKVRQKYNLKNLWIMLPFVRTVEEFRKIKKIIASYGLMRGPSLKLWLMVEVPSNVILLEDFIKVGLDGVSIGTNDLTMLILGTDRDNAKLARLYDEENPAVLWALERVIKLCQITNVTCSICGQAPSSKPEIIKKLVKWGITSISVNPDAIGKARELIAETEKEIVING